MTKLRIFGDIVVLVDISASMVTAIEAIRSAWVLPVRQSLDSSVTDGPRVDLRLKVVGYAMSGDGTQPVIRDNPFVHNDVAALDAQFANLKTMPTNHSPRPLLDALWQAGCMGEIVPGSAETADSWRNGYKKVFAVYADAPCRGQTMLLHSGGANVQDVAWLFIRKRIGLHIQAPMHPLYMQLGVLPGASFVNISVRSISNQFVLEDVLGVASFACATTVTRDPRLQPSRPRCAVRNTGHGCEVWTEGDAANDVAAHLGTQGFLVGCPVPDPSGRFAIIRVRHSAGPDLDAANIRVYLRDGKGIWDFVEFGELQQQEAL